MIKKTPEITYIIYWEIFQRHYSKHLELKNKAELTEDEKDTFLMTIINSFYDYLKFLNYKCFQNKKILPLKLIKFCSEKNLIDDSDILISLLNALNMFYETRDTNQKKEIRDYITENFSNKLLEKWGKEIESNFSKSTYEEFKNIYENNPITAENYNAHEIVNCNTQELEKDELFLLKYFFQANKAIKNVWLIGSRAYGTNNKNADMDFIIDCDEEEIKDIKKNLQKLPIKYYTDASCLNSKIYTKFLKQTCLFGVKKIYSEDDDRRPEVNFSQTDVYQIYKHFCVENYKTRYNQYIQQYKIWQDDKENLSKQKNAVHHIHRALIRYNKFLKIELNLLDIEELVPLKIYKKAIELNLGCNNEYCINFIKELNAYYDTKNSKETRYEIGTKILSESKNLEIILNFLEKIPHTESYKNFLRVFNSIKNLETLFDNSTITYEASQYNIDKHSYNVILDYAKNHPEIERIWISGSRLYEHSHNGSDIDILIDCDLKLENKFKKELKLLKIPYIIDATCIHNNSTSSFIKKKLCFCL